MGIPFGTFCLFTLTLLICLQNLWFVLIIEECKIFCYSYYSLSFSMLHYNGWEKHPFSLLNINKVPPSLSKYAQLIKLTAHILFSGVHIHFRFIILNLMVSTSDEDELVCIQFDVLHNSSPKCFSLFPESFWNLNDNAVL